MLLKSNVHSRTIMRVALACVALSSAMPVVARRASGDAWLDLIDGAQGAFLGAALVLLAVFFRRTRTPR
jgi:hypothetical protein